MLSGRELELERERVTVCGAWILGINKSLVCCTTESRSEQVMRKPIQMVTSVEAMADGGLCFAIGSGQLHRIHPP
jgi:hypothetical protein